jgi:prolyl oligopeptidase PreP (S9A serine peptidase family)
MSMSLSVLIVASAYAAPVDVRTALSTAPFPPASSPVVETRFGITTTDPYRYLENLQDPEVQTWMKAEADRTRTILGAIPGRADVLRDIERLVQFTASQIHDAEILRDGRVLALRQEAGKDFNACAQYLVDNGYTSPSRLASLGGSAAGIVASNSMIERPDLYRVAFLDVGVLDAIGFASRAPGGTWNQPEFGDPGTEEGYRALHAMSSYFKVRDGADYPAVMLIHGVEDPRVPVWQSNKMAARLQQASSSGRPVLLRLDYEAGHGIGNTQGQANGERADLINFMLWQFGEPGFQPELAASE